MGHPYTEKLPVEGRKVTKTAKRVFLPNLHNMQMVITVPWAVGDQVGGE
jgi:hypothetical protein